MTTTDDYFTVSWNAAKYVYAPMPLVRVKYADKRPFAFGGEEHYIPRHNLPDLARFSLDYSMPFTKQMQDYIFELFKLQRPDWTIPQLLNAMRSTFTSDRAFTNKAGLETNNPKYMTFAIAGNVLVRAGENTYRWGAWQVPVRTLDPRRLPDPREANRLTAPWYIHAATIITKYPLQRGGYEVRPFYQLGGVDVPIPIFSYDSLNYIRADAVEDVPDIDSPYQRPP